MVPSVWDLISREFHTQNQSKCNTNYWQEKLQRAEQQRALKLMKIRQKAQAEETKVNEILFINELQEQNKRHDVLNRILEHDARLQELQQERSKMFEVKAAKEETVKVGFVVFCCLVQFDIILFSSLEFHFVLNKKYFEKI